MTPMTDSAGEWNPCPFCGGLTLETGGDDKFVGVRCVDCEAVGPNHYITGRDWNTRAAAPGEPCAVKPLEWKARFVATLRTAIEDIEFLLSEARPGSYRASNTVADLQEILAALDK